MTRVKVSEVTRTWCVQSSGKLEMERGMVKPMIRGELQDGRTQDGSANRSELSLPASIEFRENCESKLLLDTNWGWAIVFGDRQQFRR